MAVSGECSLNVSQGLAVIKFGLLLVSLPFVHLLREVPWVGSHRRLSPEYAHHGYDQAFSYL